MTNTYEAIEFPRINSLHPFSSFDDHKSEPGVLEIESRFPAATLDELKRRGIPVVTVAMGRPRTNALNIRIDDFAAAKAMTSHLVASPRRGTRPWRSSHATRP